MNQSEHALQGANEYKLDPKCRVSVPSDWRNYLGSGQLRLMQSSCYKLKTLRVVTQDEYESMLADVEAMEGVSRLKKKNYLGRLHSRSMKLSMSEQGKMSVPKAWCERPGLEPGGAVWLVGRGTYFELLNVSNYEEMGLCEEAETDELNDELGFF